MNKNYDWLKTCMDNVKQLKPLVHNITNYVTVNDCANIILEAGGSPIMADDVDEVEAITSICHSLVINIGTLNQRTIPAMLLAGKRANTFNHPIILDPVGVGASELRTHTAVRLIRELNPNVIKCNISEFKTLYKEMNSPMNLDSDDSDKSSGVDANAQDCITDTNIASTVLMIKKMAHDLNAVIAVTGCIDVISDGQTTYLIRNGHPDMGKITGTGCMLSSLIGTYTAANCNLLEATATAVVLMGIAGEIASKKSQDLNLGTGSMRVFLHDAIDLMSPSQLITQSKIELF